MEPKIPENIKATRLKELQALQDKLTINSMNRLKGKIVEVLVEGKSSKQREEGPISYRGREPGGRVVNFLVNRGNINPLPVGSIVDVKITEVKKTFFIWGGEKLT